MEEIHMNHDLAHAGKWAIDGRTFATASNMQAMYPTALSLPPID
jgi:hypothetical protein